MNKGRWIAGGLMLVTVIVAVVILLLRPAGGLENTATVIEAINQVDAHPRPKDDWQLATRGLTIYGGGQVRTGSDSSARLELLEGMVRLSADTVFTVKESTARQGKLVTTLFLQEGRLWASLTTDQPHEFTVETGNAIAAVRDSRFSVEVRGDTILVSAAEGKVTLTAQGRMVTVGAGEQATVEAGRPPSLPEPMSAKERTLWATEGEMPELAPPTPTVTPLPTLSPTAEVSAAIMFYGFNTAKPPFDNRMVRQAFALALDREALAALANAWKSSEEVNYFPATTMTPPHVLGRNLYGQVGLTYNPDRARELLDQAGYPGGASLPTITFFSSDQEQHQAVARAAQAQWRGVLGVEVALTFMPWSEYNDILYTDPPHIWRLGWLAEYIDPYSFLHDVFCYKATDIDDDRYQALRKAIRSETDEESRRALYAEMSSLMCPSWQPTLVRWDNADYTALLTAALNEPDPEMRRELYVQAERILCETDAVVIPLYWW
jgi:hypothetical protein